MCKELVWLVDPPSYRLLIVKIEYREWRFPSPHHVNLASRELVLLVSVVSSTWFRVSVEKLYLLVQCAGQSEGPGYA